MMSLRASLVGERGNLPFHLPILRHVFSKRAKAFRGPCRPGVMAPGRTQSLSFHGFIAIEVKASDKPLQALARFEKTLHKY